ncbi:DUF6480 family protein [Streptomyces sp. PU-14G]|jgi:hypothetical protein|uniref:DUF6480 family protein n=1 Tax=Streptomyces sp. PU-14G TaxID=2800808 RepID=UPI0034DF3E97
MRHANQDPDPDPDRTPGLERGGQVPPGETPPAEGSMSEAGPRETHNPTKGWSKGPLVLIALVVVVFLVFFIGYLVGL